MGAADFNTGMTLEGSRDELLAMLNVVKDYVTKKRYQYRENRDCAYLMSAHINGPNESGLGAHLSEMNDDDILKFIDNHNGVVEIDASGPYGVFGFLDEVDLFRDIAEAAPNAKLVGGMGGFNSGGDMAASFELKDGLLHCKYFQGEDEEYWEDEDEDEEDWDEDDDWEYKEPDWTDEEVYDPVKKKYVR